MIAFNRGTWDVSGLEGLSEAILLGLTGARDGDGLAVVPYTLEEATRFAKLL